MSGTRQVSPLFGLPLELREEIYKSVLLDPSQGSDLLRTCQEIEIEARKFIYQRELIFPSQGTLYAWLAETPRELLVYVSTITIHIQDVDLRPILSDLSSNHQPSTPLYLPTSGLYRTEVDRLGQSLMEIPKLTTITLRAALHQPSILYRQFVNQALKRLGKSCPDLLDLRLRGNFHYQGLEFLTALTSLEHFSFNGFGFSSSSPIATVKILASLGHLRKLSLVSEHAISTPNTVLHGNAAAKRHPFTREISYTAKSEPYLSTTQALPVFSPTSSFISEVFGFLHDYSKLKSVSIRLSQTPDVTILMSLGEFLRKSPITRLELDWPDLQPSVLERFCLLSNHLELLWARTQYGAHAFGVLWSIVESRQAGRLNNLRQVVLIRPITFVRGVQSFIHDKKRGDLEIASLKARNESSASDDQDDMKISRAKRRLRNLGINVAWYTENLQPVSSSVAA